jgi:hypothetical protein
LSQPHVRNKLLSVSLVVASAILFSLFTVFSQVTELSLRYLETSQVHRHARVIEGHGGDPYQYRVLSEYLVEGAIQALRSLGFSNATTIAFILFRVLQNTFIFVLASAYY